MFSILADELLGGNLLEPDQRRARRCGWNCGAAGDLGRTVSQASERRHLHRRAFAGLLFTFVIPFLCLFVMLMLLPRTVLATGASLSEEAQTCLSCHATLRHDHDLQGQDDGRPARGRGNFKGSVHTFDCTACHSDVSLDTHPATQYASRQQFLLHLASACRTCHAEEQLMANPQHGRAITRANAPPCSGCHGSHSITKVPTKQEKFSTPQYCLACHTQQLSKSIKGETVSLTVNEDWIKNSVHRTTAALTATRRTPRRVIPSRLRQHPRTVPCRV